jgi:hypothetical protein
MNFRICLFLMLVLFAVHLCHASDSSVPEGSGVFYLHKHGHQDAEWIMLDPAAVEENRSRGLENYLRTGGYTHLRMSVAYKGATSPVSITASKPTFFIRDVASPDDLLIVRLAREKDRRVIRTTPDAATIDNKAGFRPDTVFRLNIDKTREGILAATPEEPLPSGEYLLVVNAAVSAYDFTISAIPD